MTVKEFHSICASTKEMYVDYKGNRIRVDYSKPRDGQITELEKFKLIQDYKVCAINIEMDHEGKPWQVIYIL